MVQFRVLKCGSFNGVAPQLVDSQSMMVSSAVALQSGQLLGMVASILVPYELINLLILCIEVGVSLGSMDGG